MSRVWSSCQTEEPWKLGGLQVRPTEEGTEFQKKRQVTAGREMAKMCGHGMCGVGLRDSEWGMLTGEKFMREQQGRRTSD